MKIEINLTLDVGGNKITVSESEARSLYEKLTAFFGEKSRRVQFRNVVSDGIENVLRESGGQLAIPEIVERLKRSNESANYAAAYAALTRDHLRFVRNGRLWSLRMTEAEQMKEAGQ